MSTLLAPFSVAPISPGLPVFRTAFGTTDAGASLLLSAILVPGILLSPVMGLLTDRLGRRRVLVSGLVAWSLAGGSIVLRPSFPVALALRLVQGAALAGIGVTTVTLIGDVYEGVATMLYGSAFVIDFLLFGAVFTGSRSSWRERTTCLRY